jgi:hypothetical protein
MAKLPSDARIYVPLTASERARLEFYAKSHKVARTTVLRPAIAAAVAALPVPDPLTFMAMPASENPAEPEREPALAAPEPTAKPDSEKTLEELLDESGLGSFATSL